MCTKTNDRLATLYHERRTFEDAIVRRFGRTLTREDAEDVVAEALFASADSCPDDAKDDGRAWFMRVVMNRAEDYRRARDGRPRAARGQRRGDAPAVARRFVPLDDAAHALVDARATPDELAQRRAEREAVKEAVAGALAELPPRQAEVLRLRHLADAGDGLSRAAAAARLGLSLSAYEALYTAARKGLRAAMLHREPTDACAVTREALASPMALQLGRARVETHLAGCMSCRLHQRVPVAV
jgi:RNA polymerase sigma factor (sigma-70 family)